MRILAGAVAPVARLRADGAAGAARRPAPRAGGPARRATGEAAGRRRPRSLAACRGRPARHGSGAAPCRAAARRRQGDDPGGWPLPAPRPRRRADGRGDPAAAPRAARRGRRGSRAWCATTCSPTPPTGPMPPCGASCAAWASTCWPTSSPCARPTTWPPASTSRPPAGGSCGERVAAVAGDPLEAQHLADLRRRPGCGARHRARAAHRAAAGGAPRGGRGGSGTQFARPSCWSWRAQWPADRALLQSAIRSACPRADDRGAEVPIPAMTALARTARLEHRLTRPTASLADLHAAAGLAIEHELATLLVSPWMVRPAARLLARTPVRVGDRDRVPAWRAGRRRQGLRGVDRARARGDPAGRRPQRRGAPLGRRRCGPRRHAGRRRDGALGPRHLRRDRQGRPGQRGAAAAVRAGWPLAPAPRTS